MNNLTKTQENKLIEWYKSKNNGTPCPVCGGQNFIAGDLLSNPIHNDGKEVTYSPTVSLYCNNCAHLLTFAAAPIGLL